MVERLSRMPIALRWRALRAAMLLLLTALLLVQTVGVLHRVAHAKPSLGVSTHQASDGSGALAAIWGEHSNSAECQLFDQTCPDLLHLPFWALPVLAALPIWVAAALQERFALSERFYAARGPPAVLH